MLVHQHFTLVAWSTHVPDLEERDFLVLNTLLVVREASSGLKIANAFQSQDSPMRRNLA